MRRRASVEKGKGEIFEKITRYFRQNGMILSRNIAQPYLAQMGSEMEIRISISEKFMFHCSEISPESMENFSLMLLHLEVRNFPVIQLFEIWHLMFSLD